MYIYNHNQYIVKIYGVGNNQKIKIIRMNTLREKGFEDDEKDLIPKKRSFVSDSKMNESISRSKAKIFELAFCNPWKYFFTGTLSPEKYDRTDLEKYHKDLTQYITNYNKKHKTKIRYLFIPELHKDGKSWHMHGFIEGLPDECLHRFEMGDQMGASIADRVKCGFDVYSWTGYAERFGYCDLEPIQNAEAVSKYITKYISKGLATSVKDINAHIYYHSRGLQMAQEIYKGSLSAPPERKPDYEGDYCAVWWEPYTPDLLFKLTHDNPRL